MKFTTVTFRTLAITVLAIGTLSTLSLKCPDATDVNPAVNTNDASRANGTVVLPAADFDNQIAEGIVILDFFATWCPPCGRFSKVFATVAAKHTDILFIKVDIDTNAKLANDYGIRSMPTVIALKDGVVVKTNVGYMSIKQFEDWIKSIL